LQSLYKIKYPRLIYNFEEIDKRRKVGEFTTKSAYPGLNAIKRDFEGIFKGDKKSGEFS